MLYGIAAEARPAFTPRGRAIARTAERKGWHGQDTTGVEAPPAALHERPPLDDERGAEQCLRLSFRARRGTA